MKSAFLILLFFVNTDLFAGVRLDIQENKLYFSDTDAQNLYTQLVRQGIEEFYFPELPIHPSIEYSKQKQVAYKNIECNYYVLNPDYKPAEVDFDIMPVDAYYSCVLSLL